jgi:hypothetical protein
VKGPSAKIKVETILLIQNMATIGLYEGRVVVLLGKMSKNKIPKEENGKTV